MTDPELAVVLTGSTAGVYEADDPLFAGVAPVVAVAHGDVVRERGDGSTVGVGRFDSRD